MQRLDESLARRAQRGDKAAREEIFNANTGLIWACVRKYAGLLEKEDLFQLGAIGLLKAIDRFDPSFGVAFSTFAIPCILGEMRRQLRDDGPVKVERRLKEIAYLARKTQEKIRAETGKEPTVASIAEAIGVPVDVLCQALEATAPLASLEDAAGFAANQDATPDPSSIDLRQAMADLEPPLFSVIEGRFFLGKTQSEISAELGISQAQVSRLEKKALTFLRERLSLRQ